MKRMDYYGGRALFFLSLSNVEGPERTFVYAMTGTSVRSYYYGHLTSLGCSGFVYVGLPIVQNTHMDPIWILDTYVGFESQKLGWEVSKLKVYKHAKVTR